MRDKDIKNLIDASILSVNKGSMLVVENVSKLEEIKDGVGKVCTIMQDIAGSMRTQESSIVEINNAVKELDSVTQQNSALVEEIAGSSESLSRTSNHLAKEIDITLLGKFQ